MVRASSIMSEKAEEDVCQGNKEKSIKKMLRFKQATNQKENLPNIILLIYYDFMVFEFSRYSMKRTVIKDRESKTTFLNMMEH